MKRILVLVTFVVLTVLVSNVMMAQSSPFIGTWKERKNNAEPKYSRTLTYEAQGNGVKVSAEGTTEDGARFAYSYTANYDGKDNPVSGTGAPGGADTIALKRIDSNTVEAT